MARDRQTSLRLDGELLERLQKAARDNRRTLGAEISLRLEQSFQPSEPAAVLQRIAEASNVLAEAGAKLAGGRGRVADEINKATERVRAVTDPKDKETMVEAVLRELQAQGVIRTVPMRENPNPYAEADAEAARRRRSTRKEKV